MKNFIDHLCKTVLRVSPGKMISHEEHFEKMITEKRVSKSMLALRFCSTIGICIGVFAINTQDSFAQTTDPLNCSAGYQIVETFANGAKWEMCWEPRAGYGYRLNQVIYTPPNRTRRLILNTLHLAQLFVPYDDGTGRWHDISAGRNLTTLSADECPGGTLQTNSILCLVRRPLGYAIKNEDGTSANAEGFTLFGYIRIGTYYYIIQYGFNDDGSFEPALGASGALQLYGGDTSTGWPIGNTVGMNHNHLAIWRLDFDIDGAENDLVEQIDFDQNGDARNMAITASTIETKTRNDLGRLRFWRVRDIVKSNSDGHNVSYEIEPNVTTEYRTDETFTQNDFYVTQQKQDETIVDDGAGLDAFVNGETVSDVVVWYGVNFHHVPREEDEGRMPVHWQGFVARPRDLEANLVALSRMFMPIVMR
jgi:primary-amine oxidase